MYKPYVKIVSGVRLKYSVVSQYKTILSSWERMGRVSFNVSVLRSRVPRKDQ